MKDHLQNLQEVQDLAQLQAQMQKPMLNANIDGGFEMGWGTALVCLGMVPYVNAVLPKSAWASWIGFLPLFCGAVAAFAVNKLVKRFITWPRTGYVANTSDVKLKQLVMLMVFGGALGGALVLPFILVAEIRHAMHYPGAAGEMQTIILRGCKFTVCAILVAWLWPRVITKRKPLPSAYDSALIKGMQQMDMGRKVVRRVKLTLLLLFLGIPVLVCGIVVGANYWSRSVLSHGEIAWAQLGVLSFTVGCNAVLYLMGNAVALKQHRWKWLTLALIVVGPLGAACLIPLPTVQAFSQPVVEMLPPQAILCMGLTWFLSGLATLVLFTRQHPLPAPEAA